MSSSRFPGKVLAPFQHKPLIKHIIDHAREVKGINRIVVLTSIEESDDPLISYLKDIHCDYFRGHLENVFSRFQSALKVFDCDYVVRLSADSPFIDSRLISFMLQKTDGSDHDVVSNVFTRTFPKGQSVEIIKSKTMMAVNQPNLSKEDCEHIFPYFYRHENDFKLLSIRNNYDESNINLCIDTFDDLKRLSSYCSYYFRQDAYAE